MMKSLDAYNIVEPGWIVYRSKICSLASSVDWPHSTDLNSRITEMAQSYLNQWGFIITTYSKLHHFLTELNKSEDTAEGSDDFSEYDLNSVDKESELRDYAYLLIISMKTLLDLFACIVDIVTTMEINPENKMTDIVNYGKGKDSNKIQQAFNSFRDKNKYPWIDKIIEGRNRLIHRGYLVKVKFSFIKSGELNGVIYKGTDFSNDVIEFTVGELFDQFMQGVLSMEEEVSIILSSMIPALPDGQTIEMIYKFGGGFAMYDYKELWPSESVSVP